MQGTQPVAACVRDEVVTGGLFFKYLILHLHFWHKKAVIQRFAETCRATKVSIHESFLPSRSMFAKQSNYVVLKYKTIHSFYI